MAYDEGLAQRIRDLLDEQDGVSEKKMFGGVAFLVHGNMAAGVVKSELMVRVGADAYEAALAEPHARPMDFTKKPMRGLVYVSEEGIEDDTALARWLRRGVSFAASLPKKRPTPSASAPKRARAGSSGSRRPSRGSSPTPRRRT